jgi:phytoene dehydrogenase-like protein
VEGRNDAKINNSNWAGIARLSAGCYALMNGYKTQILEMPDKPGGLRTSWQHKGFTIDGCLGLEFTHTGFTSEQVMAEFEEVVSIRRC